ncbi:EAL domain-containing protein, partial [Acidithiobacillus thiooxidans]
SMDDFGTGYSSLLSVARLRFDELKLDQSFIRAFREDIASFGVAGASHLLSQLTDCDLVAEGISTPDELHLWLQLGGRYIQGYLLSPPLPENAFFTWRDCLIPPVLRSVRTVGLQDMAGLWQEIHA